MKTLLMTLTAILLCQSGHSQFTLQTYSGTSFQFTKPDNYGSSYNIPWGFRAGVGIPAFQVGIDYAFNLKRNEYVFNDPYTTTERFRERFYDRVLLGFVRFVPVSHAEERIGPVFRLGAGARCARKNIILEDGSEYYDERIKLKSVFDLNLGMGINIPYDPIFISIEYDFHYFRRPQDSYMITPEGDSKVLNTTHGIHLTLGIVL